MNQSVIVRPYVRLARESLRDALVLLGDGNPPRATDSLIQAVDALALGLERLAELVVDP